MYELCPWQCNTCIKKCARTRSRSGSLVAIIARVLATLAVPLLRSSGHAMLCTSRCNLAVVVVVAARPAALPALRVRCCCCSGPHARWLGRSLRRRRLDVASACILPRYQLLAAAACTRPCSPSPCHLWCYSCTCRDDLTAWRGPATAAPSPRRCFCLCAVLSRSDAADADACLNGDCARTFAGLADT